MHPVGGPSSSVARSLERWQGGRVPGYLGALGVGEEGINTENDRTVGDT